MEIPIAGLMCIRNMIENGGRWNSVWVVHVQHDVWRDMQLALDYNKFRFQSDGKAALYRKARNFKQ